jgi:hypothetical protein
LYAVLLKQGIWNRGETRFTAGISSDVGSFTGVCCIILVALREGRAFCLYVCTRMLAVRVECSYDLEQKITVMNDGRTYAAVGIMFENVPTTVGTLFCLTNIASHFRLLR